MTWYFYTEEVKHTIKCDNIDATTCVTNGFCVVCANICVVCIFFGSLDWLNNSFTLLLIANYVDYYFRVSCGRRYAKVTRGKK